MKGMSNALTTALGGPWLIIEGELDKIITIASREHEITPEALDKIAAEQLRRSDRATVRDGVAILDVKGPLFKYANIFTEMSGATSYQTLMRDLQVAVDDPSVHAIMLNVDSPGGHVSGCDELSAAIHAARQVKPVEAFVSGAGASAAYWLASSADRITITSTTIVGSIGAVMKVPDSGNDKGYTFVSSQSPNKVPDPATDTGKASMQKIVDDLAAVFIEAVAKNRGIDAATVISKFGAGGVETGANAVAAGMADSVGQFEDAIAALAKRGSRRTPALKPGGIRMSTNPAGGSTTADITIEDARAQATADATSRIKAITGHEAAAKVPTLAKALAFDTSMTAADAATIMAAAVSDMDAAVAAAKPESNASDAEKDFLANKAGAQFWAPGGDAAGAPVNHMKAAVARLNAN